MPAARPRKWKPPRLRRMPSARECLSANLRRGIAQAAVHLAGAAHGSDPEFLHQLRVGLRRLRATLHAFRPLLRRKSVDVLDGRLRALLRSLGPARDWDVFCRDHRDAVFAGAALRQRTAAWRNCGMQLHSGKFEAAMRDLSVWTRNAPWRRHADPDADAAAVAGRLLGRLERELRKSAEDMDWRDARKRHRVRIRVKRLRYGVDCFPTGVKKAGRGRKRLRQLQEILGRLNDIDVQRRLLRSLRVAGLQVVLARLDALERDLIAQLEPAWQACATRQATARVAG